MKDINQSEITKALETEKPGKLLFQYATPAIIGNLINSFYHIIDSVFIGHGVGPYAIAGLGLTFPIMNLTIAFGTLVGMGAATRVSIYMGQKNIAMAEKILGNALTLTFLISFVFTAGMLYFLDDVLWLFGGSENTIPYARDFMQIILLGNILNTLSYSFNNIMRSSGYPGKAIYTMVIGAVANVILAPVFIFVLKMGIRGAAIATVISMSISAVWVISHFFGKNSLLKFKKNTFRLQANIVKPILSIGVSPFLMNLAACLVVIFMNISLKEYGGDLAIGAYGGIVNRLNLLIIMIIVGLNQGMQPIAGFNFGAQQYDRVKEVLKVTIKIATIVTTIGFLAAQFIPELLVGAFTSDESLIEISKTGLRLSTLAFVLIGFQIVTANFFQSIGMVSKSIFLSLSRQFLFLIPLVFILPHFFGLNGVWYAMAGADFLSFIVTACLLYIQMKNFNSKNYK
ncbi:MAG: MATE family efflux transporter [Candidatus Azobacteroides sp.]|nr:MATE family efflux transporter [Candidatus Azobacteroides sp.]